MVNQKGGVGKTTTAVNLSAALALSGQRTLLLDMDPQCNATTSLGLQPTEGHALVNDEPINASIAETGWAGLSMVPGSRTFHDIDKLAEGGDRESGRVRRHLDDAMQDNEFILIDCPPSVGDLTQTALAASTEVLMPIQCEYFAMEGLTQMIEVIRGVMQESPGKLSFGGILLTMYDPSLELTAEVESEVREFFGEVVFDTVVPRDPMVTEAPSHGLSVLDYAPRSRGTRAYIELCMEVLERD